MTTYNSATLIDGLHFPEGPRWRNGELFFSDFYQFSVLAVTPTGATRKIAEVPGQPSGLGWLPDGRLLIVSMLDQVLLVQEPDGTLNVHADLSDIATGYCNDMVVDKTGRAYVGNFGFDMFNAAKPAPATLAIVAPDGTVSAGPGEVMFPNGSVITPDGKTFIIGESMAARLSAFDINTDGSLTNRRVWADIKPHVPDGTCLDAEGAVWSADPRSNCVIRVAQGGEILDRVETIGSGAYACALGGEDRQTLFICTSSASGPAAAETKSGRIETVQVAVPGAGWP